jgi:hypothetical protein
MQDPSTSRINTRVRTGWRLRRTVAPGATTSEDAAI